MTELQRLQLLRAFVEATDAPGEAEPVPTPASEVRARVSWPGPALGGRLAKLEDEGLVRAVRVPGRGVTAWERVEGVDYDLVLVQAYRQARTEATAAALGQGAMIG